MDDELLQSEGVTDLDQYASKTRFAINTRFLYNNE